MRARQLAQSVWSKFLSLSDSKKAVLVCGIALIVIILRRPELIFNAQFWAEDFAVFYQDSYKYGVESLLKSYSGMLQTFPRIIALLLGGIPLAWTPLAYNTIAILVMVLPLFILWSDRTLLQKEGPAAKALLSVLYLLLPNIGEIFGNITNSLWFLAFASLLILIRSDPKNKWLVFDCVVLVIAGLTGPFAPILAVVAIFLLIAKKSNNRGLWIKVGLLIVCALIQLAIYMRAPQQRTASLYAQKRAIITNYHKPIQITGMRFFMLPVAGEAVITDDNGVIAKKTAEAPQVYVLGISMIVLAVAGFLKSRSEIRAIILFGALIYSTSLVRAQTVSVVQFWDMLQLNTFGGRYFFIPFIAWIILLCSLALLAKGLSRILAVGFLALYLVFFPFSFGIATLKDTNFPEQVQYFNALPPGEKYCFDINPDEAWKTCLDKK